MNSTLKIFAMLLGATLFMNVTMNYMGDNVDDFGNQALPPVRHKLFETNNPVLKVSAQSKEKWTLVDFSSRKTFQISDPEKERTLLTEQDWDLGFQRTKIISNGGVTNPQGKVAIANLGPVEFNSVTQVPEVTFVPDTRSWGNVNNPSIIDWYLYRTRTHNIESKRNVYIVQTGDGLLKLRILNYYCQRAEDDCKTSMCSRDEAACLTVEYHHIPPGEQAFPVPEPPPATLKQTAQAAP
jgi:HmuY protein